MMGDWLGTHSQSYYRTTRWMFTKLGGDEERMIPHMCQAFKTDPLLGTIHGGAEICLGVL